MDRTWFGMGRLAASLILAGGLAASARAQQVEPPDASGKSALAEQLNRVLTDPAEMEKADKLKDRDPIVIYKSTVLPNDVLPYTKANHWSTMALELRSNLPSFEGALETQPIALRDMPHEVVFRRDANLVKGQRSRLLLQAMTPTVPRELLLRLTRPEALRSEDYNAALRVLEPHQMLIPVLTKGPNDAYGRWNLMRIMFPLSGMKSDALIYDKQRYYRMVLPSDLEKPQLPSHPLTWTTISHIVWEGMPIESLAVGQQDAMLDWLHWGGQLIIVGGAGPNFAPFRESFLGPYLPADPSGSGAQLSQADLEEFANEYPPLAPSQEPDDTIESSHTYGTTFEESGRRYRDPAPIPVPKDKPMYVAALTPRPGSRVIGFGKPGLPPMAVECRVGRGRILMVGPALTDPSLMAWQGYETMIRRVVLRRPEEVMGEALRFNGGGLGGYLPPRYDFLTGPDLTWVRIFGRDLGSPIRRVRFDDDGDATASPGQAIPSPAFGTGRAGSISEMYNPWQVPVAEWLDNSDLPRMSREALERASGIEIPGSRFVMMVIIAYVIALVPINWLLCRFALGRREWAWAFVPILAIGFAIAVERAAAYDVGYDSACNEIDVIETFGNYPRGHLSRFASLYTTGRVKFSISYPSDPSALALPLNTGRAIRGEEVQQSVFQSSPTPTLSNFQVQPRSLAMFRSEQYMGLPGSVTIGEEGGVRTITNGTEAELRDAVVVEMGPGGSQATYLGTIGPKQGVELKGDRAPAGEFQMPTPPELKKNEVDPSIFLTLLVRSSGASRMEDVGEVRLLAWSPRPQGGQTIEPAVDLHKGFTLIVSHLRVGATPDPASPRYDALAMGPERPSAVLANTPPPQPMNIQRGMPRTSIPPPTTVAPIRRAPQPVGAVPSAPVPGKPAATPRPPDDDKNDPNQPKAKAPENPRP